MRSQLFASGVLVALLGAALYVLYIPLAFSWSLVFVVGGAAMSVAGLLAPEGGGPVLPPEGYRFCRFCTAAVPLRADRCPKCNGLQQGRGSD